MKQEIGTQRLYNAEFDKRGVPNVVRWDIIEIIDQQKIRVVFEAINSEWRQGIWLRTDGGLIVNGQRAPSVTLWQDTAPPMVECQCFTSNGYLSVYNVWDVREGRGRQSQAFSSGMIVEETLEGRRYRCNDIGFSTNFDKLVFLIEVSV